MTKGRLDPTLSVAGSAWHMSAHIERGNRSRYAAGAVEMLVTLVVLVVGSIPYRGLPVFPIGAALALFWVWRTGVPWPEIGYARPRHWATTILDGVLLGIALKLILKSVVMPLLGAPAVNHGFQFLVGNEAMLPVAIWAMLVAGFAEETVFRGFLFERLRRLFGSSARATVGIVLLTSLVFGVVHYWSQGLAGAQQAVLTGLAFGTMFATTKRIWMPMIAHATFDLTALGLIYWGLEADVSRAFFS
jgi:membrane protease YdiL (CAAX protease family)